MSGTQRILVITAPDGTEVTKKTAGKYDTAGIVRNDRDQWHIVAVGTSEDSVRSRTRTLYGRGCYRQMFVGQLHEQTAPVIRDYFGGHRVAIDSLYRPDLDPALRDDMMQPGWTRPWSAGYTTPNHFAQAGRTMLRKLAKDGWTAVAVRQGGRVADFQIDEILKSMNARRA